MIKINLLPIEKRREEKTPFLRFLIIILSLVGFLLMLIWNLYLLRENKERQWLINMRRKELEGLAQQLTLQNSLRQEQNRLQQWIRVIRTVEQSRPFKWWENIDILLDIFERFPKIWIVTFVCEEILDQSSQSGLPVEAKISFDCRYAIDIDHLIEGERIEPTKMMTDFRKELKTNPELRKDFDALNPPDIWSLQPVTVKEVEEDWEVAFRIELYRLRKTREKPVQ